MANWDNMLANGMHLLIKPLSIVEDCRAWQGSGRRGQVGDGKGNMEYSGSTPIGW